MKIRNFCLVALVTLFSLSTYINANQIEQKPSREQKLKQFLAEAEKQRKHYDTVIIKKQLRVKAQKLTDATGLVYIGAIVNASDLTPYLRQLIGVLGTEKFATYRANQAARDHHSFHITLVNPFELKSFTKKINLEQSFTVTLIGLGHAQKELNSGKTSRKAHSYFVVAESPDIQLFRNQLGLKNKDLHVTLGFDPTDVFGVDKSRNSLVTIRADK